MPLSEEQYVRLLRLITLLHRENTAIAQALDDHPNTLKEKWDKAFWYAFQGEENENNT